MSSSSYRELRDSSISQNGGEKQTIFNRNVVVILLYTFVVQMARSIWQSQILSIYLYDLCGDMRVVGYIEGVQGICRLVTALLTGYVVDNCLSKRKNAALRFTCIYGMLLFGSAAYCTLMWRKTWIWYVILTMYSPQRSMQMSIVGVIFADSMRTGDREIVYTIYRVVSNVGSLVGPIVQIVFFYFSGDDWSSRNLRTVMVIGIALSASALPIQLFIDENRTLKNESEAKQRQKKKETISTLSSTTKGTESEEEDIPLPPPQSSSQDLLQERQQRDETDEFYARVLRWSVVTYDLFRVLFGGLVDKYFGIFFKDTLNISPIDSSLIQLGCRLGIIITTGGVGWISKKHVPAALVCLTLLFFVNAANVTLSLDSESESSTGNGKWILVAAYIVRGSALVSVFGLKHALLMDRVPKKHRGKYSAIDDLQSGFWSGSAALGGWLIHRYSYRTAFSIMSGGFGLATCSWFGVVYSDCKSRQRDKEMNDEEGNDDDEEEDDDEEQQHRLESTKEDNEEETEEDYDTYDDISHRFQNIMLNDSSVFDDGFIPSRSSLRRRGSKKRRRRHHSRFRSPSLPSMRGGKLDFFVDDPDFALDRTWPPRDENGDLSVSSSLLSRHETH